MANEEEALQLAKLCGVCTYLADRLEELCIYPRSARTNVYPYSYTVKEWLASAQIGCTICVRFLYEAQAQEKAEAEGLFRRLRIISRMPEDTDLRALVTNTAIGYTYDDGERNEKCFRLYAIGQSNIVQIVAPRREESRFTLLGEEIYSLKLMQSCE
jgi:hypothetical protein